MLRPAHSLGRYIIGAHITFAYVMRAEGANGAVASAAKHIIASDMDPGI